MFTYVWGCAELGRGSLDHLSLRSFSVEFLWLKGGMRPTNVPSLNNQAIKLSITKDTLPKLQYAWYIGTGNCLQPHLLLLIVGWKLLEEILEGLARFCQALGRTRQMPKLSATKEGLCTSSLTGSGASRTTPTTLFAWRSLGEVFESHQWVRMQDQMGKQNFVYACICLFCATDALQMLLVVVASRLSHLTKYTEMYWRYLSKSV